MNVYINNVLSPYSPKVLRELGGQMPSMHVFAPHRPLKCKDKTNKLNGKTFQPFSFYPTKFAFQKLYISPLFATFAT